MLRLSREEVCLSAGSELLGKIRSCLVSHRVPNMDPWPCVLVRQWGASHIPIYLGSLGKPEPGWVELLHRAPDKLESSVLP